MGKITNWFGDRIEYLRKSMPTAEDCPKCGSNRVVKIEPCTICPDRFGCRESRCTKYPYFISGKGYTQVLKCVSCGHEWNIIKRV